MDLVNTKVKKEKQEYLLFPLTDALFCNMMLKYHNDYVNKTGFYKRGFRQVVINQVSLIGGPIENTIILPMLYKGVHGNRIMWN